jgi:predicted nuclease of predicted toxin-antitoxin system
VKFLIDECLSPELAALARARGFSESTHVTWLGMRSRKDWAIVRRAVEDGFVFVTNDTVDFRALYEREEIHAGLVCLNVAPGLMRLDIQKSLFLLALDRLGHIEPLNEALEVTLTADGDVILERYALPSE